MAVKYNFERIALLLHVINEAADAGANHMAFVSAANAELKDMIDAKPPTAAAVAQSGMPVSMPQPTPQSVGTVPGQTPPPAPLTDQEDMFHHRRETEARAIPASEVPSPSIRRDIPSAPVTPNAPSTPQAPSTPPPVSPN